MASPGTEPLLSILIPTLEQRSADFARIHGELCRQIRMNNLDGAVELLSHTDNGELPTGTKRNELLLRATGEFVASVDDDDAVHPEYVPIIVEALRANPNVDCLGLKGEITFRGTHAHPFICSLRFRGYRMRGGIYERPPHHLNPIRTTIARRYPFEPVRRAEDSDWAYRLSRDGALRQEFFMEQTLYHYRCRRRWAYQATLDHTEFVRHRLGLVRWNQIRFSRWLRSLGEHPSG
jgi:glycosyltransferase involved in cell wall biosynthesis